MKKRLYSQIKKAVDEIAEDGFQLAKDCNRTYAYDYMTMEVQVFEYPYWKDPDLSETAYPIYTDEGDWEHFHECFDCRNRYRGNHPIDRELADRCEFESIYYNLLFHIPDVVRKIMEDKNYET